jgi:hypothetical protein
MNLTLKAILARFGGNVPQAVAYCNQIADTTKNIHLAREYNELGQKLWRDARAKELAAHA